MELQIVDRKVVKPFIETYHYSKSINGCKVTKCFALYRDDEIVGAVLFGPVATTAWKKYGESEQEIIELRRLVTLDDLPRNTCSWMLSKCIKILRQEGIYKKCVSYADPRHGHCGYVYQASNWNYEGTTQPDTVLVTPEGREYHSRALRTKYKGDYKPFVKRLREMMDNGELKTINIPGKHIYTYNLQGKQKPNGKVYPKLGGD